MPQSLGMGTVKQMGARRLGLVALLLGCAGTDLDIGHDASAQQIAGTGGAPGAGGTGGTGSPSPGGRRPEVPPQSGCPTDPELEAMVGTWEGNVEDFYLRPIKHLRIVINGISQAEGVCGSLTWGTLAPPPPADDSEAIYPSSDYWHFTGGGAGNLPPIDGFAYTLVDGGARVPNVRVGVASNEPWHSFCQLQTPMAVAGGWACVDPDYTVTNYPPTESAQCFVGGETHTAFHCLSCNGPSAELHCQCDAEGCVAGPDRDVQLALELATDGMSLSGPFIAGGPEYHFPIVDYPSGDGSTWQQGVSIYLERVQE